ncbi:MAG: NUDIX hydrolase [Candidatus Liptonbacteria bacterium]|nr:NUDIX hydrolase [Candidatus Liptonbacteria bacterium]
MKKGKSVGAIVSNLRGGETVYLVQYRLAIPVGLAFPAGHVDAGEKPDDAIRRELFEETGLTVERAVLSMHRTFANPCGKGHAEHEWWVYSVSASGILERKEPTKHKFVGWMNLEEIRDYLKNHASDPKNYPYDPAWFEHILPEFDII